MANWLAAILQVNGGFFHDLVKFVEKILQLAVEGVRNTRSYPKTGVLALLMLSYMNADA